MSIASAPAPVSVNDAAASSFVGIPVTITNQLSIPLDIYDVFNPAAKGQVAPYLYTKLGTIAAGATGIVTTIRQVSQLEAMYTGTVQELQGWYYRQFPVKLMSGTQFGFGSPPPLSYAVAESDRTSMIESFLFHKFAMANPDSALTKNLNAALKQGDPKAVNDFFAGTQNFKNCTLSSWNAVMTWLTMFTSGWQGPYYLYEAAPSSPPAGYVPALVGTVNIVSTASAGTARLALCSQDGDGSVRPLDPPQESAVVMAGDGTMVDQNPGQDVSLTLTPVWMNTIQTTMSNGKPVTSYISGPTLTGTVAGKKVVSTQTLMPLPTAKSGKSGSSGSQTFGTICQVVGLIVGLVMLYEIVEKRLNNRQAATEENRDEATSESDYESRTNSLDEDPGSDYSSTFTDDEDSIASDASGVADGYAQASRSQQRSVLEEAIDSESEALESEISSQLEDGLTPTPEFETAVGDMTDSFREATQQIEDGNLAEGSTTMADAASSMQETLKQSAAEMQQSEVEALQDSADAVDTATSQADALSEAQDQYEEDMQNEAEDSGAPDEDITPETEPIEAI